MKNRVLFVFVIAFAALFINQSMALHSHYHPASKIYLDDESDKHSGHHEGKSPDLNTVFGDLPGSTAQLILLSAVFLTSTFAIFGMDTRFKKFLLSVFYQSSYFRKLPFSFINLK
ncbi:hypothetical protein [Metabacillus sp. RGM 3146]|uniref:hypothetical protein n=1 Tax=Metabacillus sp. RGM 3146 TaxID=3401092 RepID=UPI003B99FFA3